MKVYKNVPKVQFGGGLILVAANSKEEAIATFRADPKFDWAHDFITWEDTPPYWDEYYYHADGWEEMPQLIANVETPQVLIENSYCE